MPIPKPTADQSKDDFLHACMRNSDMQEYAEDQRTAICEKAWSGDQDSESGDSSDSDSNAGAVKTESINDADLALINKFTLEPLTSQDVFTFSTRTLDSEVTANNRRYMPDFLKANVDKFPGRPVILDHLTESPASIVGKVYSAEIRNDAIYTKAFIPLTTELGREAANRVKAGMWSDVSVGVEAYNEKIVNENGRKICNIYASDRDKVRELSFVTVPAVKSASVVKTESDIKTESLVNFANQQIEALRHEFVKQTALNLGNKIDRKAYEKISENMPPELLQQAVNDLRQQNSIKQESLRQQTPNPADSDFAAEMKRKRKVLGV